MRQPRVQVMVSLVLHPATGQRESTTTPKFATNFVGRVSKVEFCTELTRLVSLHSHRFPKMTGTGPNLSPSDCDLGAMSQTCGSSSRRTAERCRTASDAPPSRA